MSTAVPPPPSRRAWLAGVVGAFVGVRAARAAPGAASEGPSGAVPAAAAGEARRPSPPASGNGGSPRQPALRARLAWRWHAGAPLVAAPHVGPEGRVAVATVEGTVQVLAPDGAHAFTWVLAGPAAVAPALGARGEVFAASSDGRVVALHPDEGLRWSARLAPAVGRLLAPAPVRGAEGGPLLALGRDGVLVMISPRGRVVRRVALGRARVGPVLVTPAPGAADQGAGHRSAGRVLVGLSGGVLLAADAEGRLRRERLGGRFQHDPAVAADGTVLVVLDDDLVVLEPDTWRERFTRRGVESAAFTPGGLVVRERARGSLLWLDRRGAVVARAAPGDEGTSAVAAALTAQAPGVGGPGRAGALDVAAPGSAGRVSASAPDQPTGAAEGGARAASSAAPLGALGVAALVVEHGAVWAVHPGGERLRVARGATYPWAPAVDAARGRVVLGTASGGVEVYEVEVAPWT